MKNREVAVSQIILELFERMPLPEVVRRESADAWARLSQCGTALWLDSGDLEAMAAVWDPLFSAMTTNNSLLYREIVKGAYDGLIPEMAEKIMEADPAISKQDLLLEINFVLSALHGLRLARTYRVPVSVELHTDLANDVERSVEYARRFHAVAPDHFFIKVPYSPAGLLAAYRLEREHIPVNLTLGFSVRQNYLAARLANPHYVNVFLGRLNTFVKQGGLGSGENVGEKTVLDTQKMVSAIRSTQQTKTRLIAASVRSAEQVQKLAGVDVITMPVEVADHYQRMAPDWVDCAPSPHLISMRPGYNTADIYGSSLWDLEETWQRDVNALLLQPLEAMRPDYLISYFSMTGHQDFMPSWKLEEIDAVLAEGKIPDYKSWAERLRAREVGLDALMNISALSAFVQDQARLDEYIQSLL
jgi:transaldolase